MSNAKDAGSVVSYITRDILIREEAANKKVQDEYINFLRGMFKGSEPTKYIRLAYLTGILPIKRVKTQSALNNFDEFTMIDAGMLAPYIGFTEDEAQNLFLLGFVLAGFNFHFGWFVLPNRVSWMGAVIFLCSCLLYAEVLRENSYLPRTVEVQEGQRVINTGLYGIVRHPMYSATIILFLSMPLVLGSVLSFFVFLAYPFIIAKRIRNEEAVLEKDLDRYIEYE